MGPQRSTRDPAYTWKIPIPRSESPDSEFPRESKGITQPTVPTQATTMASQLQPGSDPAELRAYDIAHNYKNQFGAKSVRGMARMAMLMRNKSLSDDNMQQVTISFCNHMWAVCDMW